MAVILGILDGPPMADKWESFSTKASKLVAAVLNAQIGTVETHVTLRPGGNGEAPEKIVVIFHDTDDSEKRSQVMEQVESAATEFLGIKIVENMPIVTRFSFRGASRLGTAAHAS